MSANWFKPAEDAALEELVTKYGTNWKEHIRERKSLNSRSPSSCENRVQHKKYYGLGESLKEAVLTVAKMKAQRWPAPGVILFQDDPRAVAECGLPRVYSPAPSQFGSGRSIAGWAAEGGGWRI